MQMRLKSVRITEFQSILDSNEFEIGDITCLVGKNEAGKTALLQALYRLNPLIEAEGRFDVTYDYPRSTVEDYQQDVDSHKRNPAEVVHVKFTLEPAEVSQIEKSLGSGILLNNEISLSKGYENNLKYEIPVNEESIIRFIIDKSQLPARLATHLKKASDLQQLGEMLQNKLGGENNEHFERVEVELKKFKGRPASAYIYEEFIVKHLPKFMYYDEYYQMTGRENLEALNQRVGQNLQNKTDYPLLGLLEMARISIHEVINPARTQELVNKLEGASNHLSGKILRHWSQNQHIELRFDVRPARPQDPQGMTSGTNIWANVYDSKHKVTTSLGSRSRGFIWFFSFLAWFNKVQKENKNLILLLDEPGLFLHGKAQEDLLGYIEEELKSNHQVIYTTHSPFMVDSRKFERVRIVQDKEMDSSGELSNDERGTKVLVDVLEANQDSLFPLQGALGYEIYQTLFVGPNSLVVEGVSDLMFLQAITTILGRQNRTYLSPQWTITPVGGANKVPTFVSILSSQKGMKVATLVDFQKKDQQLIENLYKKKLLEKQNVRTYAEFMDQDEADLEDMLGSDLYLLLVNKEYEKNLQKPLTPESFENGSPRILVRLNDHFSQYPMRGNMVFSHYRPARYFTEHLDELESAIAQSVLSNFETMFKVLNRLLE